MAELIIKRKKEFAFGFLGVSIYLDGKKMGHLNSGQIKKWNIPPGKHTLLVKGGIILKSKKITFEAKNQDIIAFAVESFGNGYTKSFLQIRKVSVTEIENF